MATRNVYKISLTKLAEKNISKMPSNTRMKIEKAFEALQIDPFGVNSKLMAPKKDKIYRYKIEGYRIVYQVINEEVLILILSIGPRGDVYKK